MQANFRGMGCVERRLSSHQCILRAIEFASKCNYDDRYARHDDERVVALLLTMYGSCVGAFVAIVIFVTVLVTIQRYMRTKVFFYDE